MLGRERTRVAGEGLMTWWRRHAGSPDGNPPLCEPLDENEARARFSVVPASLRRFFPLSWFLLSHSISRLSILSPLSSPVFFFVFLVSEQHFLFVFAKLDVFITTWSFHRVHLHTGVFLLSGWIFKLYLNDLSVLMETFESSVPSLRAKFIQSV